MSKLQHPGDYPIFLAYDAYEPTEGADHTLSPVLFLHGITASRKCWTDIPQQIADRTRRKVYALDARNHGDSDWSYQFSFDMVTKDLDSFMDRHSIRRAIIVGHSMGGIASIKLALTKQERVEKLIVEDMFVRKVPEELAVMVAHTIQSLQNSLGAVPEAATEEEAIEAIQNYVQSQIPLNVAPPLKPGSRRQFLALEKDSNGRYVFKANLEVLLKTVLEYEKVQKEPEGRYDGKALFIYGSLSQYNIGNERNNIKTYFPNAEFLSVEGATHLLHADNPEEFTEALSKFILN